jgi:hypothetical protein
MKPTESNFFPYTEKYIVLLLDMDNISVVTQKYEQNRPLRCSGKAAMYSSKQRDTEMNRNCNLFNAIISELLFVILFKMTRGDIRHKGYYIF